ncbi:MAG: hypothetical protein ACFFE2_05420 [Candidatus Thorarchaeota archaeon]
MTSRQFDIKHERVKAVVFCAIFCTGVLLLLLIDSSLFMMFIALQLIFVGFGGLVEYFTFRDDAVSQQDCKFSPSYGLIAFIMCLLITSELADTLAGIDEVSGLVDPIWWLILLTLFAGWCLGMAISRQIYIAKPTSGRKETSREQKEN